MSERVDVQQLRNRWWVQYEERAEKLHTAGLFGAADDIRTLIDGLRQHERERAALLARLDALEEVAEKAREDWRDRFEVSYTEAARGFLRGFTVCEVELAKALARLREGEA